MSPEELQAEIRRHEEQHEQWLRELEANRADLMRMYEEEGVDDSKSHFQRAVSMANLFFFFFFFFFFYFFVVFFCLFFFLKKI